MRSKPLQLKGPDMFLLPIVGESFYQDNIASIVGKQQRDWKPTHVGGVLVLEDENPRDSNAVRVDVRGKPVGYLSRENAAQFRTRLAEAGLTGKATWCRAKIVGTSEDRRGLPNFGVWLDLPIMIGPLVS